MNKPPIIVIYSEGLYAFQKEMQSALNENYQICTNSFKVDKEGKRTFYYVLAKLKETHDLTPNP